MENVIKLIKEKNMFKSGAVVGVGVSGGSDSMALLHFLNANKEDLDIEVVAIHVDHCLRETSGEDSAFVARWCKENRIRLMKFRIDVNEIIKTKKVSIEAGAREGRYGTFETCVKKGLVDCIALAHHESDQAETVLMHILRGSGLSGAKGMELIRGFYVRPFLQTSKNEILDYIYSNHIEYVDDESNMDIKFARNLIRNKIMPLIKSKWPNAEKNLTNFAEICKIDDEYINKFALTDGIIKDESSVKIPLSYFVFEPSVSNRIIFKAISSLGVNEDFEKKHVDLLKNLATMENGAKLDLPCGLKTFKEYDYVTLIKKQPPKINERYKFKCGKIKIDGFGTIQIKKVDDLAVDKNSHKVDFNKIPKDAVWRIKEEGDYLAKFGGGTKKLRTYLIEKKIPLRLRNNIPVLAQGSEVLVVACLAISSKIKIDETTKQVCEITYEQK